MNTEQTVKILTEQFGGKHWENYGHNRVYFDGADIASRQGLEWGNYNSGNISSARLNGEKISNSECRRILNGLDIFKIWYDLNDNQFHTRPISNQSEISYPASREMYGEFIADVLAAIA